MGGRDLTDAQPAGSAFGESRTRVLVALQDSDAPMDVGAVAATVQLHPNTVRFHLDALTDAGLVARAVEHRDQPGRPRTLYSASPEGARLGRRSYRLLAEILAGYLDAHPHPGQAARQAGEEWGRFLADRPIPYQRTDTAASVRQLVDVLGDIGFAPEVVAAGRRRQVHLHHCPFREAAEKHPDVVCSVHLGLMQGLLGEIGAPVTTDRLDPFVEPHLCVAHLKARKDPQNRRLRGPA
ncbi:MAG TPA: helix-turn-helix domain-containing protein [Mycobacteriales bacterium]|nr:helix-turn-helix domain-containing protein [Mycobacteriales bacterium]